MEHNSSHRISVVVPAFNEEKRLAISLPHLLKQVQRRFQDYEIIVVDDGSIDSTAEIVRKFSKKNEHVKLIRYQQNMGKGFAVRTGVLEASKDYILFCDADLSTPFRELRKLLKAIDEGCDIAIGSRAIRESRILERQPIYRVLMGKTFNKIVQLLAFSGIKDTQCGFKCFKASVAQEIFRICRVNGFSFDVETLYLGRKKGYSIKEIGVLWRNDKQSRVHPVFHSLQMFRDLLVIRFWDLCGYYGDGTGFRKRTEASSSR